jgi:hypothetical protein
MEDSIEEIVVSGDDPLNDWSRKTLEPNIGCVASHSVVSVGSEIYYMDQNGQIRALVRTIQDAAQGASSIPVSESIKNDLAALNHEGLPLSSAILWNRVYHISVPTTKNGCDLVYSYDTVLKAWAGPRTGMYVGTWMASDLTDDMKLYFGDSGSHPSGVRGRVYEAFSSKNDDGAKIEMRIRTKEYSLDHLELEKVWNELEAAGIRSDNNDSAGILTINARIDSDNDGFQLVGSFDLAGSVGLRLPFFLPSYLLKVGGIVREQFHLEQFHRGRTIQFEFVHDDLNSGCELMSLFASATPQPYEGEGNEP